MIYDPAFLQFVQSNTSIDQVEYEIAKQNIKSKFKQNFVTQPVGFKSGAGLQFSSYLDSAKRTIDTMIQKKKLESYEHNTIQQSRPMSSNTIEPPF